MTENKEIHTCMPTGKVYRRIFPMYVNFFLHSKHVKITVKTPVFGTLNGAISNFQT